LPIRFTSFVSIKFAHFIFLAIALLSMFIFLADLEIVVLENLFNFLFVKVILPFYLVAIFVFSKIIFYRLKFNCSFVFINQLSAFRCLYFCLMKMIVGFYFFIKVIYNLLEAFYSNFIIFESVL
jgi:hypothetical protein